MRCATYAIADTDPKNAFIDIVAMRLRRRAVALEDAQAGGGPHLRGPEAHVEPHLRAPAPSRSPWRCATSTPRLSPKQNSLHDHRDHMARRTPDMDRTGRQSRQTRRLIWPASAQDRHRPFRIAGTDVPALSASDVRDNLSRSTARSSATVARSGADDVDRAARRPSRRLRGVARHAEGRRAPRPSCTAIADAIVARARRDRPAASAGTPARRCASCQKAALRGAENFRFFADGRSKPATARRCRRRR